MSAAHTPDVDLVDPILARFEQLAAEGLAQHYVDATPSKVALFPAETVLPPKPIHKLFGPEKGFAEKHNRLAGTIPASGYYEFQDHYVGLSGTVLDQQRRICCGPDLMSSYWMGYLSKLFSDSQPGSVPPRASPENAQAALMMGRFLAGQTDMIREIDDSDVIVNLVKPGRGVYGHWLLDVLPMVWHFLRCREAQGIRGAVKYLVSSHSASWALGYMRLAFGIERADLIAFDDTAEVLRIKRLIVPSLMRVSPLISPRMNGYVQHLQTALLPLRSTVDLPRRIFVSRSGYAKESNKLLLGSDEVDDVFRQLGITTIRPEDLSWPDQVALFSNAELVCGEFGSGIHNTIFGGPDLLTVALLHRKYNWNQSSIAALRGQQLVYVSPTRQEWTGLGKGLVYEFDASMLREALTETLDTAGENDDSLEPGEASDMRGEASPSQQRKPAILAVATRGHHARWQFCIESHRAYAQRHGIEYVLRTEERPPHNAKWTKIAHVIYLLSAGRDVMMIDADAELTEQAPDFRVELDAHPDKDIFFVNGASGRPNSGVMLFRGGQTGRALAFLRACINGRNKSVPPEDFVTADGENGHVIHFLKMPEFAERALEVSRCWNSSLAAEFDSAYVRHYTNDLPASLTAGTLQRLSRSLRPSSEQERAFQLLVLENISTRDRLLSDLCGDSARLGVFKETVAELGRRSELTLSLPETDDAELWIRHREIVTGILDASSCTVVCRLAQAGMVLVDVGGRAHLIRAALGAMSNGGQILALPPSPETAAELRRNVGHLPRIVPFQPGRESPTLGSLLAEARLTTPDLLLLDADGLEARVLEGIGEAIIAAPRFTALVRVDAKRTRARALAPEHTLQVALDLGLSAWRINPDFSLAPGGIFDSSGRYDYLLARPAQWPELDRLLFGDATSRSSRRSEPPARP